MKNAEILASVDAARQTLTSQLQSLVRLPSLPGHEQQAQRFYAGQLRQLGLEVSIVESKKDELEHHPAFCDDGVPFQERLSVVGRWQGTLDQRGSGLIVNGHMDVVTPGDESLWTDPPWSGVLRDGCIYGRGACDMKAGLVAGLVAVSALRAIGFVPAKDVLLQSVIGEETGGVGTLTLITKGFAAEAAIITEPTELVLCPVQAGALTFRLRIRGRSAHASIRKSGVSAIEKFFLVLESLRRLEQTRHLSFHSPLYTDPMQVAPVSIGTIHAGEWHSTVPQDLVAEGRYGVLPGESIANARAAIAAALDEVSRSDEWLRAHPPELDWFEGQFESGQTDLNHPILSTLSLNHRTVTGREPAMHGVTYGSDLRLFTNHASIPAVLYGPGSVTQAHAVDEFVAIDEVLECAKVLALTIAEWCGG